MNIIGISGKMGSGKDYLANLLFDEFKNSTIIRFADSLKEEVNILVDNIILGISKDLSLEEIYNVIKKDLNCELTAVKLVYNEIKNNKDKYFTSKKDSRQFRKLYQLWGTDVRRKENPSYWTDKFINKVNSYPDNYTILVPDVRFPNEADTIKDLNGIVVNLIISEDLRLKYLTNRDNLVYSSNELNHTSETALKNYLYFDLELSVDYCSDEYKILYIKNLLD